MWIQFHSDETGNARGFAFNAEAESVGCGGILHGKQGNKNQIRTQN